MDINLSFQDSLFALLKYYGVGNKHKFDELISKSLEYSGIQLSSKDQHWTSFATFQVLKYVGAIDTSETNMTRWSYSLKGGYFLRGTEPYFIGESTKVSSVGGDSVEWKPFFSSNNGHKFCLYKLICREEHFSNSKEINPCFAKMFEPRCPSWQQVESICTREDQWIPFMNGKEVEVFDFSKWNWKKVIDKAINERVLIRIPLDYSRIEYRIIFPKKNRSLRVIHPEWVFVIAARLLGEEFPGEFFNSQNILSLSWRAKLPTILMRYLCSDNPSIISGYSSLTLENIMKQKLEFIMSKYDIAFKEKA